MNIQKISGYALPFPFKSGGYSTSYGHRTKLNTLLLRIDCGDGIFGYGEVAQTTGGTVSPLQPAFLKTTRRLVETLLHHSITDIEALRAHLLARNAKSNQMMGIETACLDAFCNTIDQPLYNLLGGARVPAIPQYFTIGDPDPEIIATAIGKANEEGIKVFQVKLGYERLSQEKKLLERCLEALPKDGMLLADANGGWSLRDALDIFSSFREDRLVFEEPCATYEDNRLLAERMDGKILLDQCMDGMNRYLDICRDGFAYGTGLKPTILGGLNIARAVRDLCGYYGIRLKIDDAWSSAVGSSACLSIALGADPDLMLCGINMDAYFEGSVIRPGSKAPMVKDSLFEPNPERPGLGIDVNLEALGDPLFSFQA